MAFPTKSGGKKSSKFRASRYDREHAGDEEQKSAKPMSDEQEGEEEAGGQHARARANKMNAHGEGNPETHAEPDGDEAPGMEQESPEVMSHEEIKGIAAQHGPAHTIHMSHDHAASKSHIHSVHADGHEHHHEMIHPDHVMHAHHHAMHAAGMAPPEAEKEQHQPEMGGGMDGGEESYGEPL